MNRTINVSITGGMLSEMRQTLKGDYRFISPASVTVGDAHSTYNSDTGVLVLTDIGIGATVTASASVDLSNTVFTFVDVPALSNVGTFNINFSSNNTNYSSLQILEEYIKYGDTLAYGEGHTLLADSAGNVVLTYDGEEIALVEEGE